MPIYNGIEFIDESVASIIDQTYDKWELIIGINGHPKNSDVYKKAKLFESKNNKIKVLEFIDCKGKSNTLNNMIQYCNYEYVAILDVDDVWINNKLEIQSKWLDKYDVIGTNCVYFGDINGVIPSIPQYDFSDFNFAKVNPIINSSVVIKKELCNWNSSSFDGIEDYDLWIRLRISNKRFYNCPYVLVKHRIHSNSAFNSKGKNNKLVPNLLKHYSALLIGAKNRSDNV